MKKMDKKGFTLIELLAVIVILAIIMVIAVPQILDVITKSRTSAWDSNVKMIIDAIETNEVLLTTDMTNTGYTSVSTSAGCTADNIKKVADIAEDTVINPTLSGSKCTIVISPNTSKGQFKSLNGVNRTYECTSAGCTLKTS